MKIELKNLKVAEYLSEETLAFSASVYVDGKRVGEARNSGRGGNNDVDVRTKDGRWDRDLTEAMEAEAKRYTWSYEDETYTHNLDSYIGELVDVLYEKQQLKRSCRNKTLFRKSGETYAEGQYHVLKRKYTPDIGKSLRARHGNDIMILNETL